MWPEDDDVSTVLRSRFDPTATERVFVLSVTDGPERGTTYSIEAGARVLVGTSQVCDVRLTDREVSRRHASIDHAGDRLRIRDLGSTNGTFVDGVGVVEAFLRPGATLRVGASAFTLAEVATAAAAAALPPLARFGRVLGASTEMRRIYPICARLAASQVPVVIEGETGTGKEVLAETLHEEGPRASKPFVVFDCTAVPPNLVEAELFGHERGAFTGADRARKGVFEQAHEGTLLIDEIGDFDLALQPKLLRAIERSEIRRVGGDRPIKVDVRILAATRRDLDAEVAAGRFRDDLFHRLAVARVELPPLRRRVGDVALLARHFLREFGGDDLMLPPEVMLRWESYDWPGNVRELRNVVSRRVALGELANDTSAADEGEQETAGDGDVIEQVLARDLPLTQAREEIVAAFERRYVERVLQKHGGNVAKAAAASGIARRHFQRIKARTR